MRIIIRYYSCQKKFFIDSFNIKVILWQYLWVQTRQAACRPAITCAAFVEKSQSINNLFAMGPFCLGYRYIIIIRVSWGLIFPHS